MFDYIIARLKERSTWLSLVTLATVAGISLSPEQQEAIVTAGAAIAAAIGVFTSDK